MKYLTTRELRNTPGLVRDQVREDDLVLTANGKPVAILVGVDEGDVEETMTAIRQARGQMALARLQRDAAARGLDKLSPDDVDAEIRAARGER
jgi:prevent-host-death family protein